MARKKIKKVSVAPIDPITGSIVDTTNIDDKTVNTYSANVIDKKLSYSTTEQVVGTWIDGKPIYRKVIDCGNLPNASNKNVPVNISNLKNIVSLQGIASYGDISFPFNNVRPRETSAIATIGLYFYGGNITIETGNDRSAYTAYVILEYTKTTD